MTTEVFVYKLSPTYEPVKGVRTEAPNKRKKGQPPVTFAKKTGVKIIEGVTVRVEASESSDLVEKTKQCTGRVTVKNGELEVSANRTITLDPRTTTDNTVLLGFEIAGVAYAATLYAYRVSLR